jgi:hypothetical protein
MAPRGQRREQLVDARQTPRPWPAELAADEEVLLDRQRGEEPASFRHEGDAAGDDRVRGRIADRFAVEQDRIVA